MLIFDGRFLLPRWLLLFMLWWLLLPWRLDDLYLFLLRRCLDLLFYGWHFIFCGLNDFIDVYRGRLHGNHGILMSWWRHLGLEGSAGAG